MAPAVSLPSLGLSRAGAGKRWADVEDCGTPTPWADYAQPGFNMPSDAVCDVAQTTKWPHPSATNLPVLLQSNQGQYNMLAQPCPAFSDKMSSGLVGFQGAYVLVAQPCPAYSEMPVRVPQQSQMQQQSFPGYQADAAWSQEFENLNGGMQENGYTMAAQWPGFAACPQSRTPETSSQWSNMTNTSTDLESSMPTQMRVPLVELQPKQAQQSSQQHTAGSCRPCAWFWRKQGCQNGDACSYCHLCPEGQLKANKKEKIQAMRMGVLAPVKAAASPQKNGAWGLRLDSLVQGKA